MEKKKIKLLKLKIGCISRVNIFYADLVEFFNNNQNALKLPVYGALLDGKNIYSEKLSAKGFIVIGNESRGINETLYPFITNRIKIPSFSHIKLNVGEAESLNAAIATSIIVSEFKRTN